ncbi:MAG: glycosyltransferase family 2 protein [Blastocatellia bacterium]
MTRQTSTTPLPSPPPGKRGWPWSETPSLEVSTQEEPGRWPRISVITPSYNQAPFLEMTLRSVLLQGYPNLEYIVIDGGSTDGSVALLEKYAPWLTAWVSEPDEGQSQAINKGLRRATGETLCWINSDDYYLPGTLATVGRLLARRKRGGPESPRALVGHIRKVYVDGRPPIKLEGCYEGRKRLLQFWRGYQMHQPAIFWDREVSEEIGWLDEDLHLTMDFDYWVRMSRVTTFLNVDQVLAVCHYHAAAKTGDDYAAYHRALERTAWRYWGPPHRRLFWELAVSMAREVWWKRWRRGGR